MVKNYVSDEVLDRIEEIIGIEEFDNARVQNHSLFIRNNSHKI